MCSCRYKVKGALKAGCFAIAPHIADPRLPAIRTGWKPEMITFCGKVGKMIQVTERSVQLYSCGQETFWDTELFDASLTRSCYKGCKLRKGVCNNPRGYCDVCLVRLPIGTDHQVCSKHDYLLCGYCTGRPVVPQVGARVILGSTWTADLTLSKGPERYYDEGIVETDLLGSRSILAGGDDSSVGAQEWLRQHHSFFRVRWLKSGKASYCRGPPFQDVTLALKNGLTDKQPVTEEQHRQYLARLQASYQCLKALLIIHYHWSRSYCMGELMLQMHPHELYSFKYLGNYFVNACVSQGNPESERQQVLQLLPHLLSLWLGVYFPAISTDSEPNLNRHRPKSMREVSSLLFVAGLRASLEAFHDEFVGLLFDSQLIR